MGFVEQKRQARQCLYWLVAILVLMGVADYGSLKTTPRDMYLTSGTPGLSDTVRFLGMLDGKPLIEYGDGTRKWIDKPLDLTEEKMGELRRFEFIRADYGYYFISSEALMHNCIGHKFEEIDGRYRMATDITKKEDGRKEALYNMLAAVRSDGTFYQTIMGFNEEGICDQVTFGKQIKDRNSFLLKRLPGVQTIMGWDWLTWHVQETQYVIDHNFLDGEHAWYVIILITICSAIGVTLWAFAPLFIPVLLVLSCLMFKVPRYVRTAMRILSLLLLIVGAYVWMVAILCWGYPWLIGLPFGFFAVVLGFGIIGSFFNDENAQKYLYKSDGEVFALIKPIIVDILGISEYEYEVVPDAQLGNDLGCDEYDHDDILKEINKVLKVKMPNIGYSETRTVMDLVHIIKECT